MDEFSWFVGLFEGEGCYYVDGGRGVIEINMTDEDTIARAAKFLGVSYREKRTTKDRKRLWIVRARGGLKRGKLVELLHKMMPYLSIRRRENIENILGLTTP